ncbi:MAG: hypothetical protein CL816_01360 [Coxiellaceae bacterium]|nr:hypothetical protein [Coxiellaceae bacterium]
MNSDDHVALRYLTIKSIIIKKTPHQRCAMNDDISRVILNQCSHNSHTLNKKTTREDHLNILKKMYSFEQQWIRDFTIEIRVFGWGD